MCGRYYCPDVPLDGAINPRSMLPVPVFWCFPCIIISLKSRFFFFFLVDGAEIKTDIGDFFFLFVCFFGVDVKQ